MAGKLNLYFSDKIQIKFSSHCTEDFFGGFLRKIRLYYLEVPDLKKITILFFLYKSDITQFAMVLNSCYAGTNWLRLNHLE